MIQVSVHTSEIRPDGQLVDRLAATFEEWGQDLKFIEGSEEFVQIGIPVFSERYGNLIDFDTHGEENGLGTCRAPIATERSPWPPRR